jgi:AcrR family transcriptional regulator
MSASAPASAPPLGLRERQKQERRGRILEAIRALLREDPDRPPTVERIAALAELAPATVFNLLGTRDQQWEALCEAFNRELADRHVPTEIDDPRDQAHHVVLETAELFIADAPVSRYLLSSPGRGVPLPQENPVPLLRDALGRAQERGMLRPDLHTGALAGHIAMACAGTLRLWAAGQISDSAFRKRVRFAVDVTFSAGATADWAEELSRPLAGGQASP